MPRANLLLSLARPYLNYVKQNTLRKKKKKKKDEEIERYTEKYQEDDEYFLFPKQLSEYSFFQ